MNIFDSASYMPRFHCINRNVGLAWLYAVPNFHTAITYSIGFVIIYQLLRRAAVIANLPFFPTLMWLYSGFFFFCGGTHFWDAVALWYPAYKLFIVWEWIQSILAFFAFFYAVLLIKRYLYSGKTWKETFFGKNE